MLYHTLKQNHIHHSHVHVHTQMHNTKVYDRGAFLRKVLFITSKLRFETILYIILKLNIQTFFKHM
jgi:hypothetical protein